MSFSDEAFVRHEQMRWLKHDAARWVRPDAARFLKPGSRVEDVYPALAVKYSASQPRVPAGSGRESGRWTDGSAGSSLAKPMGNVGIDDINPSETEGLFRIGAGDTAVVGDRLAAGDTPGGLPIDLTEEEQNGGHGISQHVGKSERFLKDYVQTEAQAALARGRYFEGYAKGSFPSLQSANRLVNSTISQNQDRVDKVLNGETAIDVLRSRFSSPTGYEAYLPRANSEPYMRDTYGVAVVILRDRRLERGWRVQSAYPER